MKLSLLQLPVSPFLMMTMTLLSREQTSVVCSWNVILIVGFLCYWSDLGLYYIFGFEFDIWIQLLSEIGCLNLMSFTILWVLERCGLIVSDNFVFLINIRGCMRSHLLSSNKSEQSGCFSNHIYLNLKLICFVVVVHWSLILISFIAVKIMGLGFT